MRSPRSFGSQRPSKAHDAAAAVQHCVLARDMPSVDYLMQRYRLTRPAAQDVIVRADRARRGVIA